MTANKVLKVGNEIGGPEAMTACGAGDPAPACGSQDPATACGTQGK